MKQQSRYGESTNYSSRGAGGFRHARGSGGFSHARGSAEFSDSFQRIFSEVCLFTLFMHNICWCIQISDILAILYIFDILQIFEEETDVVTSDIQVKHMQIANCKYN